MKKLEFDAVVNAVKEQAMMDPLSHNLLEAQADAERDDPDIDESDIADRYTLVAILEECWALLSEKDKRLVAKNAKREVVKTLRAEWDELSQDDED